MIFTETKLKDAYVITTLPVVDDRGFFGRSFCRDEFKEHGLEFVVAQANVSYNAHLGTLRGMHYQIAPHEEAKLIRCVSGSVWDVIVDMRPDSATYKQWLGTRLSAREPKMVYAPHGFAHGYLSLTNGAMIYYLVSEPYHPECERTVRWDDPAIGIIWPPVPGKYIVSKKDSSVNYL